MKLKFSQIISISFCPLSLILDKLCFLLYLENMTAPVITLVKSMAQLKCPKLRLWLKTKPQVPLRRKHSWAQLVSSTREHDRVVTSSRLNEKKKGSVKSWGLRQLLVAQRAQMTPLSLVDVQWSRILSWIAPLFWDDDLTFRGIKNILSFFFWKDSDNI